MSDTDEKYQTLVQKGEVQFGLLERVLTRHSLLCAYRDKQELDEETRVRLDYLINVIERALVVGIKETSITSDRIINYQHEKK